MGPCLVSQIPADVDPQRDLQTLPAIPSPLEPSQASLPGTGNQLIFEHLSLGPWFWLFVGRDSLSYIGV